MKISDLLENHGIGLDEDDRDAWKLVLDLESDLKNPRFHDLVALDLADIGFNGMELSLPRDVRDLIKSKHDVVIRSILADMKANPGNRMVYAVKALRNMGFNWPVLANLDRKLATRDGPTDSDAR